MSPQRRPGNQPLTTSRASLIVIVLIMYLSILAVFIGGYVYGWKWTGVGQRTLWDWLELLVGATTTAFIGFLGYEISAAQYRAQKQHAQDEALQVYLDEIGQMLLDKDRPLRHSKEGDEVRTLARARTLTTLTRLDGVRKGNVVQFLYEAGLINKHHPVLDLKYADLRGANLIRAGLREVNLRYADLSEANLSGAYLYEGNLIGVKLVGASLVDTTLVAADLYGASLTYADLSGAILMDARLESATMPNGQKYEDWLKDKEGRGEDG